MKLQTQIEIISIASKTFTLNKLLYGLKIQQIFFWKRGSNTYGSLIILITFNPAMTPASFVA